MACFSILFENDEVDAKLYPPEQPLLACTVVRTVAFQAVSARRFNTRATPIKILKLMVLSICPLYELLISLVDLTYEAPEQKEAEGASVMLPTANVTIFGSSSVERLNDMHY